MAHWPLPSPRAPLPGRGSSFAARGLVLGLLLTVALSLLAGPPASASARPAEDISAKPQPRPNQNLNDLRRMKATYAGCTRLLAHRRTIAQANAVRARNASHVAARAKARIAKYKDPKRRAAAAQAASIAEQVFGKARSAANISRRTYKATRCRKPIWSPGDATMFNYPFARNLRDRTSIRETIIGAIESAPRGSLIRVAVFTFSDAGVANALGNAYRRGVRIRLLANRGDIKGSPAFYSLQRLVGNNLLKPSWVRSCRGSCRGPGGQLHSKLYLFSKVGYSDYVSLISSANLTDYAVYNQWNHVDTVVSKPAFVHLAEVFDRMRADRSEREPFYQFATGGIAAWVYPMVHRPKNYDLINSLLRKVSCSAPNGYGVAQRVRAPLNKQQQAVYAKQVANARSRWNKQPAAWKRTHPFRAPQPPMRTIRRTVMNISMYAWFDKRGTSIANLVRRKWEEGCSVHVIYSTLNSDVKRILSSPRGRGRIPLRYVLTQDRQGAYTSYDHSKYVAIDGLYEGRAQRLVITGSMNFTARGIANDDIVVSRKGNPTFIAYQRNFDQVWFSNRAKRPRV